MLSRNKHTKAFLRGIAKDFRFSKIVNYFLDFVEIEKSNEIQAKTGAFSWQII